MPPNTHCSKAFMALCRTDFFSFAQKSFALLYRRPFPAHWHHHVLCDRIENVPKGQEAKLLINLPPKSFKSFVVRIAFPAWLLGKNPKTTIGLFGHNLDILALDLERLHALMASDFYRSLFPRTLIAKSAKKKLHTSLLGSAFASDLSQPFLLQYCDYAIVDDPFPPETVPDDEALFIVNTWFQDRFLDAAYAATRFVVSMHRSHAHDASSLLLARDEWVSLTISAVATDSELWTTKDQSYQRHPGAPIDKNTPSDANERFTESALSFRYQQQAPSLKESLKRNASLHLYSDKPYQDALIASYAFCEDGKDVWASVFVKDYSQSDVYLRSVRKLRCAKDPVSAICSHFAALSKGVPLYFLVHTKDASLYDKATKALKSIPTLPNKKAYFLPAPSSLGKEWMHRLRLPASDARLITKVTDYHDKDHALSLSLAQASLSSFFVVRVESMH